MARMGGLVGVVGEQAGESGMGRAGLADRCRLHPAAETVSAVLRQDGGAVVLPVTLAAAGDDQFGGADDRAVRLVDDRDPCAAVAAPGDGGGSRTRLTSQVTVP